MRERSKCLGVLTGLGDCSSSATRSLLFVIASSKTRKSSSQTQSMAAAKSSMVFARQ